VILITTLRHIRKKEPTYLVTYLGLLGGTTGIIWSEKKQYLSGWGLQYVLP
jgi:hypothetical protein